MCNGGFAAGFHYCHFLAVGGGTPDIASDCAGYRIWCAPDNGVVGASERVVSKLGSEEMMGGVMLGNHHQPACILIKAVNDARAGNATNAGKRIATMGKQGIDQRVVVVADSGVNGKPCRFIDD